MPSAVDIGFVIATAGRRPEQLRAALESIREFTAQPHPTVIVVDGGRAPDFPLLANEQVVVLEENVGAPGARNVGIEHLECDVVVCLDDDAKLQTPLIDRLRSAFEADPSLAVVSFRLVDESGESLGRHIPRVGGRGALRGGPVATFLEGACAIRRTAFLEVGGYWAPLRYHHEQLDLSWRLADRGWTLLYEPDIVVYHPRVEVGRHADGWYQSGRNRVLVARRNLPWWLVGPHTAVWLVAGTAKANDWDERRAYLRGWRTGWGMPVAREPMSPSTAGRLTKLGRPPVL